MSGQLDECERGESNRVKRRERKNRCEKEPWWRGAKSGG